MILLLTLSLAFGHGGEDHGAPAPVLSSASSARIVISNERIDAALVLGSTSLGEVPVALLVADAETSAPANLASAKLALSGPGSVNADLSRAGPGQASGTLNVEEPGSYAGSIIAQLGERAELLAVSGLDFRAAEHDHTGAGPSWGLAVALGLLLLTVGLAAGWRLGRRAVAAILLLGAGLLSLRPIAVDAHGGEDHGAPSPGAQPTAGGALDLPMESQFLLGLRTVRLAPQPFQERVPAFGALVSAPDGAARVTAPVTGVLQAPAGGLPRPGTLVQAGQILANILETPSGADRVALLAGRAEATARLEQASADLVLAERDAAQIEALGDALSERERLDRQGRLSVARTAVDQVKRTLDAYDGARLTAIRAPITGRLAELTARPGDTVQVGDPLLRVVGDAALWMVGRVPERAALRLRAGADATVTTPASTAALPAQLLDAGLVADPSTGMVTVTLALDAQDLRPGLSATAWIATSEPRTTLSIPDAALVQSDGVPLVFVKTGPESFVARPVKLGARSGDAWEILAGLSSGERVVTEATGALRGLAGR